MDLRTPDLADTVVPDAMEPADEWTVVLPRRGKKRRTFLDHKASEVQLGQWAPTDVEISPERENKLLLKVEACMKILESSAFFISFMEQIRHKLMEFFTRMLGPELKLQMIVYGIGSIEAYENPRLQLSLALLMKREFEWIGEVEVFDPVLSLTESRVITSLGCSVISVNEEGKRKVLKPTLFFMPHCDLVLYNNLLLANWSPEMLNRITLFGNSFSTYEELASDFKSQRTYINGKHVLAVRKYMDEFEVKVVTEEFFRAFSGSSWHFFSLDSEIKLPEL